MTDLNTQELLESLSQDLKQYCEKQNIKNAIFIGIQTGGVWVAKQLQSMLNNETKLGVLDITFYRDDFSRVGIQPTVKPSKLPLNVDNQHIILVDDVLHTGRTIRAALNEIFDYGRPASVTLVADVVAHTIELDASQHVKLRGPEPLTLEIIDQRD